MTSPANRASTQLNARADPNSNDLAVLERRLSDGYARIEIAMANGEDITAWTDFWIDLLHRYERACDAIDPVGQGETL